jgi:chlorite dismutase
MLVAHTLDLKERWTARLTEVHEILAVRKMLDTARREVGHDAPVLLGAMVETPDGMAELPPEEQRVILAEHGAIGMSFGAADLAHDVRLACHGLDKVDNDFVIGLIGKELFPLSHIVQSMRKTQQTSLYLEHLGPFFVGRAVWQSAI